MKVFLTLLCPLFFHILLFSIPLGASIAAASPAVDAVPYDAHATRQRSRALSRHTLWRRRSPFSLGNASSVSSTYPPTSSSPSPTNTVQPMQTNDTVDPSTLHDIETIRGRRLTSIIASATGARNISAWISTLDSNGKWPDSEVDYTSGCKARRANWPAQTHWRRITTMAAAWHGGLKGAEQYAHSPDLRGFISSAMDYWFANDFTNPSCLDKGGSSSCPCDTPGFWNTNWYSNVILIPGFVGQTCLLLNDTLSESQLNHGTHITGRAYGTFHHGASYLTGANILDVARIGIDRGLLTGNASLIADAYRRVHDELVIEDAIKADGIRPDGSFGQHRGILYSGNYGKDFTNDILGLETEAGGTRFAAGEISKTAFATLIDGDRWMIYRNVLTGILHWDFSVLGRFISFPVVDNQATASIKINLTQVKDLGKEWQSSILVNASDSLSRDTPDANAGAIRGNRMFYNNDYMVHRGPGYVTTLKMLSSRTQNTECTNSQNPLGFHLADGVVHTYLRGDEYEDIAAAWDWNLIPGITVDYGVTPLSCKHTGWSGVERFVGGVSDGQVGVAAMRYTNPYTKTLKWQKTWFFLDHDVQHVMISNVVSVSDAPVFSVLDQRLRTGDVLVNGSPAETSNYTGVRSLWHGNVGYKFEESVGEFGLSVQCGKRTGNWSAIGTSTQPPATVDLFAAWIDHTSLQTPVSYTAFPGTDLPTFQRKSDALRIRTIQNDRSISGVVDTAHKVAMIVFWDPAGGSSSFTMPDESTSVTITSASNAAVIYRMDTGAITVSDPSQTLTNLRITLSWSGMDGDYTKDLDFSLPSGGKAGSSVSQDVACDMPTVSL